MVQINPSATTGQGLDMTTVAILRCGRLPSFVTWDVPNIEEYFEEDDLLAQGFRARGFEAQSVVWNDPEIDWNRFDAAVIRSTWDYLDHPAEFLEVLERIEESSCRLFNPLAAVRWNMDKHYLFDLKSWGAPIIPTYRARFAALDAFQAVFSNHRWPMVILKPAGGLGAAYSLRVSLAELPAALAGLKISQPGSAYL